MLAMFDTTREQSRRWSPSNRDFLLVLVVGAIIVMPFVAGRHPSGAQTVLVLAACVALAAICVALLRYGGQSEQRIVQRRVADWPAPDTATPSRHRGRRRDGAGPRDAMNARDGTNSREGASRSRPAVDDEYVVDQRG
jgi:hypothetical protein